MKRRKPAFTSLPLTIASILAWCDEFFSRHGRWPQLHYGPVGSLRISWREVDNALRLGLPGLAGNSSLCAVLG